MGDRNQFLYLTKHVPHTSGAVLEVGSKDYGNTTTYRSFYTNCDYVGVDMAPGSGVDVVADLVEGTDPLPADHFDLIICCSVMEHVKRPWIFADNLAKLVKPGGTIYISVPWVWRYHAYPDDYFRFSWRGIIELFPGFEWTDTTYTTNVIGEFIPITAESKKTDDSMAVYRRTHIVVGQRRKYLPYLMVNMLGKKIVT